MVSSDILLMEEAAMAAGRVILSYYREGQQVSNAADVRHKGANNPLTKADLEADRLLRTTLLAARPDYGWLSEETVDSIDRLDKKRVWVVDPIDGTKEFIVGLPQFAVSIGLVEAGQTLAACVHNPATNETFLAQRGRGATLNHQPIHTSSRTQLIGSSCLASRSETKRGDWDPFKQELDLTIMGSIAYKLSLVAAGQYDMTFTLTPKNEWDFCAGALLVTEAGGRVTHKGGEPCRFNNKDPRVRSLLASNGHLHSALLARLKGIPYGPDRHGPTCTAQPITSTGKRAES
ncbi:MAG: 3'(2'),5'-bisphosphate nucleotidase CysQ [Magnetococcales bacterium]|nr:3'(2'),5'-bisphosphate nucleotidase CysQ [Magnetococcales bacterium]